MLKGLDRTLSAELLFVLMAMGHGDDIVICDVNHPAATIAKQTTHGRLVDLAGCDLIRAAEAILSVMPLDTFVAAPVSRMAVVDDPERVMPVQAAMQRTLDHVEGKPVSMGVLDRAAFYAAAKTAFAIVRTADPGPYGCFILKKGVIERVYETIETNRVAAERHGAPEGEHLIP